MATDRKVTFLINANIANFAKNLDKAQRQFGRFGKSMRRIGRDMSLYLTAPILGAGTIAVATAAKYETLKTSIDILTGSAEEGSRVFERLKRFSAETPFQLEDIARANQTLMGFGLSADNAFESIKMIGDIAAVTGGDLQAISIAFGQAAAEGRLMTRDIRQLINQGVPAIKLLADEMGVAQSQILDLASQGKISYDILVRAFQRATAEGGMFAGGMAIQSKTIAGLFSTLRDNVSIALGELGQSIVDAFNLDEVIPKLIKHIQSAVDWFKGLSDQTKKLIFILGGMPAAIGPVLIGLGLIATAIAAINWPITLVIVAIGLLVAAFIYMRKNWDAIIERISDWSWFRNILIDMAQWIIIHGPFQALLDSYNAFVRAFGGVGIPDIGMALFEGLEALRGEPAKYKHEFVGFLDTVKNKANETKEALSGLLNMAGGAGGGGGEGAGGGIAPVSKLSPIAPAFSIPEIPDSVPEKINTVNESLNKSKKAVVELSDAMQTTLNTAFADFATTLGNVISGESGVRGFFQNLLLIVADFAEQFGKALIAAGVAALAFEQLLLNPIAAIAAGVALVAAATVVKNLLKKGPKAAAMESGGIVPPGFANDTYPALLSSGETVLPKPSPLPAGGQRALTLRFSKRDMIIELAEELENMKRSGYKG